MHGFAYLIGLARFLFLVGETPPADVGKNASYRMDFDTTMAGKLPVSWVIRHTGTPTSNALWETVADSTAPSKPNVFSLIHTDSPDNVFNLCILYKPVPNDVDVSVKLKAVSGKVDQGGGVFWRCTDESNYYICRVNPLEGNFRLYKVEKGKRTMLADTDAKTEAHTWHSVRATMIGNRITCYLDDQKLLEATDDTFATGRFVGLWTKADAETAFDDLVIQPAASK